MGCRLTTEATPSLPLPDSIVRDDVTNSRWELGIQAVRGRTIRRRSGRPFLEGAGVVLVHPHASRSGTGIRGRPLLTQVDLCPSRGAQGPISRHFA